MRMKKNVMAIAIAILKIQIFCWCQHFFVKI